MRSLLNTLMPYVRDMDRRALPPYQTYLQAQKKVIDHNYLVTRNGLGHETLGMQQLRHILNFLELDYLLRLPNHYERYTNALAPIYDSLISTFDKSQSGQYYTNYYIQRGANQGTQEYIFPVTDTNCIVNLPMYTEEWAVWKTIHPLHLWTHDSDELTTNVTNTYIRFTQELPSYAVFTIDVISLILQYVTWYKYQREHELAQRLVEESPQQYYLHRYVFSPLMYDCFDLWTIKQFNRLLDMESRTEVTEYFNTKNLQHEPQYGYISTNITQGFEYAWNVASSQVNTIRPEGLLSSRLLANGTLHQRMRYTNDKLEFPEWNRYDWCRLLRDHDLILLVVKIWERRKDLGTAMKLFTYLLYELRNLTRERPWRFCLNLDLRMELEQKAYELEARLDADIRKK